jgi:hypothetical protein
MKHKNKEKQKNSLLNWRKKKHKKVYVYKARAKEINHHKKVKKQATKLLFILENYSIPNRFSDNEFNAVKAVIDLAEQNIKKLSRLQD